MPTIREAIATFPATFGLRAYPGRVFSISEPCSYLGGVGGDVIMLYTTIRAVGHTGAFVWLDFAKGTVEELRAEVVSL
jgi:hypothetical protein